MKIKMFYKALPVDEDPAPLITELEGEVNEWLTQMGKDIFNLQTHVTMPSLLPQDGAVVITVSY